MASLSDALSDYRSDSRARRGHGLIPKYRMQRPLDYRSSAQKSFRRSQFDR